MLVDGDGRFLKLTTMALPFLLELGVPLGSELLCWASFTLITAVPLMHMSINTQNIVGAAEKDHDGVRPQQWMHGLSSPFTSKRKPSWVRVMGTEDRDYWEL